MARYKWTPPGATEPILIEGETPQDAVQRYQTQQSQAGPSTPSLPSREPPPEHPTVPPIQPMPLERPLPQDPVHLRGVRTDVATDEQGRVLTAPFHAQAQKEALPLGQVGEVARHTLSQLTGLPLGGETTFDPLTAGLNALAVVAPPVGVPARAARVVQAAPPAIRPVVKGVVQLAKTPMGRIAAGGTIVGTEQAVTGIQEGQSPGEVVAGTVGGVIGGGLKTGIGEAVGTGLNIGTRMVRSGAVRDKVKESVYEALETAAPWITRRTRGGVVRHTPIKSDQDAYDIFIRGRGQENLQDHFQRELNEVVRLTNNPVISVPTLATPHNPTGGVRPLKDAIDEFQKLGRIANRPGSPDSPARILAEDRRRTLQGEIETAIQNLPNGAVVLPVWQTARNDYREGIAIMKFMQALPELTKGGQINIQAIREGLEKAKFAVALARKNPDGLEELIDALNRGAGPLRGAEVAGAGPGVSIGGGRGFGLTPPQVPQVPGYTPFTSPTGRAAFDAYLSRQLFGE